MAECNRLPPALSRQETKGGECRMTKLLHKTIALAIASWFALNIDVRAAQANILRDLAEIATDPLKFGQLSDRLQQTTKDALAQIDEMIGKSDDIARQRLDQVRS